MARTMNASFYNHSIRIDVNVTNATADFVTDVPKSTEIKSN